MERGVASLAPSCAGGGSLVISEELSAMAMGGNPPPESSSPGRLRTGLLAAGRTRGLRLSSEELELLNSTGAVV